MDIQQLQWEGDAWSVTRTGDGSPERDLVLVFGASELFADGAALEEIEERYPGAAIVGCSTAGEIRDTRVAVDGGVATAVRFGGTRVRVERSELDHAGRSREVGAGLGGALDPEGLVHVLVLSPGLDVNGSDLVRGLTGALPDRVEVTGGLAGDGDRFERTFVYADGRASPRAVAAVGLYGDALWVGYGSMAGWDPFGPDRLVTRSEGNVVHELDGEPALDLYRRYLGPHAEDLPASGLLFPLSLRIRETGERVIRTLLGVDADEGALIFAGDVPAGDHARLMKANVDRLVDGAADAAQASVEGGGAGAPGLAFLVSCVGRRLVLRQRTEEEVEAVRDVLGPETVLTGFYSYGEISPERRDLRCELHNQTMTVTTLSED